MGVNGYVHFISDFTKMGKAQNEKSACVKKRSVNSKVHCISDFTKWARPKTERKCMYEKHGVNSVSLIL